jgi:hypothetical protein
MVEVISSSETLMVRGVQKMVFFIVTDVATSNVT